MLYYYILTGISDLTHLETKTVKGSNTQRFYYRETNAALNYEIQKMPFIPPVPTMQLKLLTLY